MGCWDLALRLLVAALGVIVYLKCVSDGIAFSTKRLEQFEELQIEALRKKTTKSRIARVVGTG